MMTNVMSGELIEHCYEVLDRASTYAKGPRLVRIGRALSKLEVRAARRPYDVRPLPINHSYEAP